MQNLDTKKEISIPKGRLRSPRYQKKHLDTKKDAPVKKCQNYFPTLFDIFRAGQKSSKSVKNIFRHSSRMFAQGENRQKCQKHVSALLDNFRAAPIFLPLLGGSERQRGRRQPVVQAQNLHYRTCSVGRARQSAVLQGKRPSVQGTKWYWFSCLSVWGGSLFPKALETSTAAMPFQRGRSFCAYG